MHSKELQYELWNNHKTIIWIMFDFQLFVLE
jgi:hypothetical protein